MQKHVVWEAQGSTVSPSQGEEEIWEARIGVDLSLGVEPRLILLSENLERLLPGVWAEPSLMVFQAGRHSAIRDKV